MLLEMGLNYMDEQAKALSAYRLENLTTPPTQKRGAFGDNLKALFLFVYNEHSFW